MVRVVPMFLARIEVQCSNAGVDVPLTKDLYNRSADRMTSLPILSLLLITCNSLAFIVAVAEIMHYPNSFNVCCSID